MRVRAVLGSLAAVSIAGVTLSGCSTVSDILSGPTVQDFQVGQCLDTDGVVGEEDTQVGDVPVVDCTEPHDGEVFFVAEAETAEFDEDALYKEADELCLDEFENYVGVDFYDSTIFYSTMYPSQDSWDVDDRQLVCVLTADQDVTQSFKDSGL